jgi:hypothetical protein
MGEWCNEDEMDEIMAGSLGYRKPREKQFKSRNALAGWDE